MGFLLKWRKRRAAAGTRQNSAVLTLSLPLSPSPSTTVRSFDPPIFSHICATSFLCAFRRSAAEAVKPYKRFKILAKERLTRSLRKKAILQDSASVYKALIRARQDVWVEYTKTRPITFRLCNNNITVYSCEICKIQTICKSTRSGRNNVIEKTLFHRTNLMQTTVNGNRPVERCEFPRWTHTRAGWAVYQKWLPINIRQHSFYGAKNRSERTGYRMIGAEMISPRTWHSRSSKNLVNSSLCFPFIVSKQAPPSCAANPNCKAKTL